MFDAPAHLLLIAVFMRRSLALLLFLTAFTASSARSQSLQLISANDNRVPAGRLENGVLTLKLDVVRGIWHPDADNDPGVDILAFQERGRAPSIPAPLIRVPAGTEIRTTVRNTLTDSSIVVFGLSGARTRADSVRINPGETRELVTHATTPGTFLYYACTHVKTIPYGEDQMLAGALIVDEPAERASDRVFVLLQWLDTVRMKETAGAIPEVNTINGRTWPHTERLSYNLGDTIRWRVINGSVGGHPMHLHGSYFTVLSRGGTAVDTIYDASHRRQVVTERLAPTSTMLMQWIPERAGNWLFHCHLPFHIMPHPPLANLKAADDHAESNHAVHGMGGLVLATTVHGPIAKDVVPRRKLRLVVNQLDSIPGEYGPPFTYRFDEKKQITDPGQTIVVKRDEPIAITVVNRAIEATAVHWHGLEIESYYDGVPHVGGDPNRTTPLIASGDSFIVKMTPPRAGTFIYHTHADEVRQLGGGLYGAFVVLEPGKKWDPEHDRPIIISEPRDTGSLLINGEHNGTMSFKAGKTYRLRLINITLERVNLVLSLMNADKPVEWNLVAADGADLPAHQAGTRPAKIPITIGQTFDVLFTPAAPGDLKLEARSGGGVLLGSMPFRVESRQP